MAGVVCESTFYYTVFWHWSNGYLPHDIRKSHHHSLLFSPSWFFVGTCQRLSKFSHIFTKLVFLPWFFIIPIFLKKKENWDPIQEKNWGRNCFLVVGHCRKTNVFWCREGIYFVFIEASLQWSSLLLSTLWEIMKANGIKKVFLFLFVLIYLLVPNTCALFRFSSSGHLPPYRLHFVTRII